jgi:hypothetical protein
MYLNEVKIFELIPLHLRPYDEMLLGIISKIDKIYTG